MDTFPQSAEFSIIDSLYNSYDILLSEGDRIHVYCEKCEDVVCELTDKPVDEMSVNELYKEIIDSHREI